jgi:hypothetical protein
MTALGWCARPPQHVAQVMRHRLKPLRFDPAPRLLMDHRPWRQIVGQHPSATARPHQLLHRIEHRPQAIGALRRVFPHQPRIRRTQRPFFVTHVTGIARPFLRHPNSQSHPPSFVHSTIPKSLTPTRAAPASTPLLARAGAGQNRPRELLHFYPRRARARHGRRGIALGCVAFARRYQTPRYSASTPPTGCR